MSSIVQHAPRFSGSDAERIAREFYGLDGTAKLLPSERDQNFHIVSKTGEPFVLKLANATEPKEVLDFQNQAMMHITRKRGLLDQDRAICPEVCAASGGEYISSVNGSDGSRHYVRLLTYLPGNPLASVRPHDSDLMISLGRFMGEIDLLFEDFDHPAVHRDFYWDLKNAGKVVGTYVDAIRDSADRAVVQQFLERFQKETAPLLPNLRTSVIHNDGNDYNVLVETEADWRLTVTGVIDFGDMVHTYTVCEAAIACAYAMMGKADPLTAAGQIASGYHQGYPFTEQELAVLFDLICMRLCTSVCMSAHQFQLEPDNEYLRISEKPAWALLHKLINIHPRFAHYVLRDACGFSPVPQSGKIVSWLENQSDGFAPVTDIDLKAGGQVLLDLSVGSPLIGAGDDATNVEVLTEAIFEQLHKTHADVGIGGYNEARLLYSTGQYEIQTENMPEYRTVHLGIDLYMKSGCRIYAPIAGRICSLKNNKAHLDYGPTIIIEHQTDDGLRFYTLYGHLTPDSLKGYQPKQLVERGALLGRIGDPQINGGWPPHLHFQIIIDMLDEDGNYPGVSRPSRRRVWNSLSPDPGSVLGLPQNYSADRGRSQDEILAVRQRHLGKSLSISYDRPLKIVRGRRQYLYTDQGQPYLDGVNNVCHVGHCHPHVVAAGQLQMPVLNTNTRYLHDNIVTYVHRLLSKFPEPLSVCFLVCTGSEANELALRMARNYTRQQDMITVDGAYHGNTQALIDISPYKHDGPGGRGAPAWVHTVTMPDGYRGPHKGTGAEIGTKYGGYVFDAVEQIRAAGREPAAFICESMLGCGGQVVLPDNYLKEAFAHVRAAGGVCIVDEVQVGFGRVGSHFWAFETQGVVPDIVTLGKPIGNGHPLAAVVTTPEIADAFANGMEYFNTFGGNPVSCAIGMAVLDVIEKEHLQENALRAGERLLEGFTELMQQYPLIGDVRGLGLYAGIELVTDRRTLEPAPKHAAYIINRLKENGILISTDGPLHNVLKLKPPIVFSEQNADEIVQVLEKVLKEDCLQV